MKDGDELSNITRHFNLSPESILFSNFPDSPSVLESGTTLVIPPTDGFYYTWKKGETLPKVAYRFGVIILSIVGWPGNGLDDQIEEIQPGTTLFIPGGYPTLYGVLPFQPLHLSLHNFQTRIR